MKMHALLKYALVGVLAIGGVSASLSLDEFGLRPVVPALADDGTTTTIAFVGDHGTGPDSWKVLDLILREGADLLVSQGDFGYDKSADEFESVLDATLGRDFPIVASIGNHDWPEQFQYQALFTKRLERTPDLTCQGQVGIRSVCNFRGIDIVSATPGLPSLRLPGHNERFIEETLRLSTSRWKICNWHMNQTAVQLGKKPNSVGWAAYEICREHGAVIVNAHEHSYSRTLPITKMSDEPAFIANERDVAEIRPGQTIVVVSGLGGRSIRSQRRTAPLFAASYTSDQDAKPGALFCTFENAGASDQAECRFVNIDGQIVDRFRLEIGERTSS